MRLRTFTALLNLVLRNSAVQTRNDNGIWDESRTLRRSDGRFRAKREVVGK